MTDAKTSICLNMIVKDEAHIILETFKNICKYVEFDYWVISDTGSTDGTQELIKNFFKEEKIPGELFEDEWKDFSHNRNKAIEHSVGKADYIFFFDADDLIHGDFKIPVNLDKDYYEAKFDTNFSYNRVIMVSNRELICRYVGVLHELLYVYKPNSTCSPIEGDYFFESRRLGNRSKNPNKYIDDANVLADAFDKETSDLRFRYAYYCAQSFSDSGVRMEEAIKWHKINLDLPSNMEYKYCSCINLGHIYKSLGDSEQSLLYYSKAYDHDNTRIEGITYIMDYYYSKGIHFMVNALWHKFKNYTRFTSDEKIFLDTSRYALFEWYNIVSGYYVNDCESAYISCKVSLTNNQNHENILQNLNLYREQLKNDKDPILKEYLFSQIKNTRDKSLWEKYQLCIRDYNEDKWHCLNNLFTVSNITKIKENESSNKILIYTGRMNFNWNDSTLKTQSIGGAEKAVIYLSRNLPKSYDIYIAGDQIEEEFDNIKYVHHSNLQKLIDENNFHTVIVSRYVCFFEHFKNIRCHKLIVSAHDTTFLHSDWSISADPVLKKYNDYIDHAVCLTKWHESNIIKHHNYLKNRVKLINNGINIEDFNNGNSVRPSKIVNKFMWSSCAGRGLDILLALWNDILDELPDATLEICSYDAFPKNDEERKMEQIINNCDSITHHGKLNTDELYELMSRSEYWLYTNTFPETSCITAMEMLMSKVVCLYYPLAGLNDTIGDYGIKVNQGEEIKELLNLTAGIKTQMKEDGKEYASSCSWKDRAVEWSNVLELNKKKWIFYCSPQFETKMIQQYIDNLNYIYPGYDITSTSNKGLVLHENPCKITFVYEVFDQLILNELPNSQFSFLNTEPLNIPIRLDHTIHILKTFPNFEYYDYSKSNLKILEENEIDTQSKTYLPYKCSDDELKKLIHLNKNTKKEFDFGIIKTSGGVITARRLKIVDFLKENNFTINIIEGWNDDRDTELAKCNTILNIHGNLGTTISNIFEHIRCDRLLKAGFNILSEESLNLDPSFINSYPNLQTTHYNNFFNIEHIIECYNNKLGTLTHNNYVLNVLQDAYRQINIPNEHINFLKKLNKSFYPDDMVIYDIGSSILHWTQNVRNLWKNSTIYPFDGMTEMKLFYDEYNKQNDTNYEYNVGVLCDEDYKRISFYQNDELSGGNSYYKEIGHPDSHKIFTESNIKHKIGMKLETIVKNKNIPMPDLIKIDVQGAELDILKGSMSVINHAKYLIVELQHTEYNEGAPLCNQTRDFLIENGWQVYAEKFSNNGPDADWCFINAGCNDIKNQSIQNQPKIIDCFIFYNELDLLTYRLNILNDTVDYFVLVESIHTFVGKEKPLFYQENKHLFEKFNHKIIHIIVDDFPHKYPNIDIEKSEQWNNEKFQRNCISRGIDKLELNNQDIIIIADVDEIPKIELLENIKYSKMNINEVKALQMDFYYYNLHSKLDHYTDVVRILPYNLYKSTKMTVEDIRFKCQKNFIGNAGWHLSYFGDEKFIKNKIKNFAHQELNIDLFTNQEKMQNRIKNTKDLFDRPTKLIHIEIEDNDNLPPDYDIYLKDYYTNSIQDIKSDLIKYSNSRDDRCCFENYADYINWQTKIGLSFEKDNNKWTDGQRNCVEQNFDTMDRDTKILDICCGDGQGLNKFKEMGFRHVYGVEVCRDKIHFAKQYGYTIYDCDICSGPFNIGDDYDYIYSSHTIEHVLNPQYTIRNIMSRLKDNGKFILILPYPDYTASDPSNEHNFKVHCGVVPLGLHINDEGHTLCNTIRRMGYKVIDYKFESYREPEIQLTITK